MDLHPYQNNRKSYDKNGFQQGQKQNKIMNYLANNTQLDQERYLRWELLLPKIDQLRAQNKQGQKMLINYVRLGVYDPFRNKVWPKLIQEPLVPFQECKYKGQNKDINLDLERTFPTHKQAKAIEEKLKVVLNSIAIALPQVGYCQGMNFIVGILLLKLNEQDAYKVAFHIFHWQKHQQLMKDLALIHEKLYALNSKIKITKDQLKSTIQSFINFCIIMKYNRQFMHLLGLQHSTVTVYQPVMHFELQNATLWRVFNN